MARIRITDLPENKKISSKEMKAIMGGNYQQGMYYRQEQRPGLLGNPWFIGAVISAAIAIPLALDGEDEEP